MKRKAILSVLCVLLVVTAISQISSAAELFAEAACDVHEDHANVGTYLQHFDDVTNQSQTPVWVYNDNTSLWEMDWTQNPPAIIPISAHAIMHDLCTPMTQEDVMVEAKLTVTVVAAWPPNIQTDSCSTPGYPIQWYTCDGDPHIFLEDTLGPLNVNGQLGNTIEVRMEIALNFQGSGWISDSVWGYIYT